MNDYCWLYSEKVLHRENNMVVDPELSAGIVYDSVTRYLKSKFVELFCANCTQKDCALNAQFGKKVVSTIRPTDEENAQFGKKVVSTIRPTDEELDVCDEEECDCEENDVDGDYDYDLTDEDCCNYPSYAVCFPKDLDDNDVEDAGVADDEDDGVLIADITEFVDFSDTINARRVVGTVPLVNGELYCQSLILDVSDTYKSVELLFDNRGSSTWLQIDGSDIVQIPACKININGEILDIDATTVELINDSYHCSYLVDAKYDMDDVVRIAKGLFRRIAEAINS